MHRSAQQEQQQPVRSRERAFDSVDPELGQVGEGGSSCKEDCAAGRYPYTIGIAAVWGHFAIAVPAVQARSSRERNNTADNEIYARDTHRGRSESNFELQAATTVVLRDVWLCTCRNSDLKELKGVLGWIGFKLFLFCCQ